MFGMHNYSGSKSHLLGTTLYWNSIREHQPDHDQCSDMQDVSTLL